MRRMKTVHQVETGCATAHRTRSGESACYERRERERARELTTADAVEWREAYLKCCEAASREREEREREEREREERLDREEERLDREEQ